MKRSLVILVLSFISLLMHAQATTMGAIAKDSSARMDSTHHLSKVGFAISGNFGGGIGIANAGGPDASHLSYPSLANVRVPNANYSSNGGLNIGFDLDLLFTKKRNLGLSVGLTYMYSSGTANFDGYHVEYQAQDGNGNTFRRLLTANTLKESLSYGNVNIPILFTYSTNPDKKLGAYIQIGPVLSVSASAKGNMSSSTDFEAVYHYDQASQKYTYTTATAPGDWVITKQAVASELGTNGNVNDYFAQHYARGYYVGLDETQTAKANKVSYHIGGGAMMRLGGIYRASKVVNVMFGLNAIVVSNSRTAAISDPISASNDLRTITLSNVLNGTSSLLTAQIGVNIGVQVRLVK